MRSRAITLMLLPLLAGCALGTKVATPDDHTPAAFEAPGDVTQAGVPLDQWWAAYNDPQLSDLINQALATAPDERTADAKLQEALATRAGALSAYWPQGNIQATGAETDTQAVGKAPTIAFPLPGGGTQSVPLVTTGWTPTLNASFDVSWEIDLFGRHIAARHKANADLAASRFDYFATRTSLEANVADQLFQARGLAIQLDDAKQSASIDQQLADVAGKKAQHGLGSRADADQAASQAAQSAAQVDDLQSQLHAARRTLLVLIGKGVDPLDSLPAAPEAGTPPQVPTSVPSELLARRPDVREAAEDIKSATGELKLDELALFPKFTLNPGASLSVENLLGASLATYAWSIGAGVAQPVLDMPRLKTVIHAQGARADQAVFAYEKAVQTAYGEAENSLVELSSDEARVKLLTGAEAQARSAYDAARELYGAGIDDLSTVLTAERTWRTARTALTGAQVQALRRSVQAFKALGGGWTPPPVEQARR